MKQRNTRIVLFSLIAAAVITAAAAAGLFKRLDRWAQDTLFQRPALTSEDIVLIGIDDESLEALGPYYTWDRSIMASALEALAADPETVPAVVAVDTLYSGATDAAVDLRLAAAAAELPNMVTATTAELGAAHIWTNRSAALDTFAVLGYEEPYEALKAVSTQGHINALYDEDGVMRHALLYLDLGEGRLVWSMAYETARLYLEQQGKTIGTPAVNSTGKFYVPYSGSPGDFSDGLSLSSLIAGEIPPAYYAGKIVLIGPYSVGLQDAYFTPIDHSRQMYGVEMQANVIQSFLEGNFKKELSDLPQLALLFLLCFVAMALFLRRNVKFSALLCLGLIVLGLAGALGLYRAGYVLHPLWIPAGILILFVVSLASQYVRAAMERQSITRTFERYVAPEIVQEILKEGTENLSLGGKLYDIAVLFVDVRGFTTMSERLPPQEVVHILNRYLTMTSACIERNRGTLDKFVGDATMAFWGAPLPQDDAVYLASKTALEIVRGAQEVSDQLEAEIGEELRVGVGVHYGPAVVGNMGSERHMDYTAIGDTVNTSARLEANAPGGKVYISRAVADALGERARFTSLGGSVRLKGKTEGFEVLTLDELS